MQAVRRIQSLKTSFLTILLNCSVTEQLSSCTSCGEVYLSASFATLSSITPSTVMIFSTVIDVILPLPNMLISNAIISELYQQIFSKKMKTKELQRITWKYFVKTTAKYLLIKLKRKCFKSVISIICILLLLKSEQCLPVKSGQLNDSYGL